MNRADGAPSSMETLPPYPFCCTFLPLCDLTSSISPSSPLDPDLVGSSSSKSMDEKFWPLIPTLPSYGYGREHEGPRYGSLIHGQNLKDVVITDSCEDMVIENYYISVVDDGIAIKSGWDQYGIAYGRRSTNILIRDLTVRSVKLAKKNILVCILLIASARDGDSCFEGDVQEDLSQHLVECFDRTLL